MQLLLKYVTTIAFKWYMPYQALKQQYANGINIRSLILLINGAQYKFWGSILRLANKLPSLCEMLVVCCQ